MLVGVVIGVSVGIGVLVGAGVFVGFGVAVDFIVGVAVGFGVTAGVEVGFTVGVAVGFGEAVGIIVGVFVGNCVGVTVSVGIASSVGVGLCSSVGSGVGVSDMVGSGVTVAASVGVAVGVSVGISVGVGFGVIMPVCSGVGLASAISTVGVTLTPTGCASVSPDPEVNTPKATAAPSAAAPATSAIHFHRFVFFVCSPIVFLSLVLIIPLLDIVSRSSCRKPAVPKRDSGYGVLSLGKGAWFWLLQDRSESFFRLFVDRRLGYADAEPLAALVVVHIFRKKVFRWHLRHVDFMHHAPERIHILAEIQR